MLAKGRELLNKYLYYLKKKIIVADIKQHISIKLIYVIKNREVLKW